MRKRDHFIMVGGNHKMIRGHAISAANSRMWATLCGHTPMNQCARPQKCNINNNHLCHFFGRPAKPRRCSPHSEPEKGVKDLRFALRFYNPANNYFPIYSFKA